MFQKPDCWATGFFIGRCLSKTEDVGREPRAVVVVDDETDEPHGAAREGFEGCLQAVDGRPHSSPLPFSAVQHHVEQEVAAELDGPQGQVIEGVQRRP